MKKNTVKDDGGSLGISHTKTLFEWFNIEDLNIVKPTVDFLLSSCSWDVVFLIV